MKRAWYLPIAVAALITAAGAAETDIKLPADGDKYSSLVARAAAHDATVDFRALRFAYLGSRAYQRAQAQHDALLKSREEMFDAVRASDNDKTVREKAEVLLSMDYTSLEAHKFLRQSCAVLQDEACADLHKFIEYGLLTSIARSGDGKTCATGWEAVQISEEYFVLAMFDANLKRQALVMADGHSCDAMDVTDDKGAAHTYFFKIDAMLAAEAAALRPRQ